MQYSSSILAAAGFIRTVSAHGVITSPTARLAGAAMKAACGVQVFNNQASDNYGNIQGELQVAKTQTDYNETACNIWQCKGYQFADNTANVQSWTAGQTVDFKFDIRAPHTGIANVSIVNTATNTVIGSPLVTYDNFGDNSKSIPANETSFSITVPSDLGDTCATAGACVVQHFWDAASIDQTYESCVDFTVGGTGAAVAARSSTPASIETSAPVTSASVSSSAVPTTLQTMTSQKATSTSASASATAATTENEDDEC